MKSSIQNQNKRHSILPWVDAFAFLTWGILLLKYSFTGQYRLLIHPNYFSLVLGSGIILTTLGIYKFKSNLTSSYQRRLGHVTLFSPGLGSSLLVLVAIAGLLIPPKILSSQTAIKRRVGELPLTTIQPQAFRTATKPEERSLIDWVRTVNAYPEPDAYTDQQANITGFVMHLAELPDNYVMLSRFVITCCAVDAYPIGIPVKLSKSRSNYPVDSWLEVQGTMQTETLSFKDRINDQVLVPQRSLVLHAELAKTIPTPSDPYSYR
ncbi:MAG: TIGR03943 family protein [Cyanobacteria bacterium J06621_8]